jgi:hypothetical protein
VRKIDMWTGQEGRDPDKATWTCMSRPLHIDGIAILSWERMRHLERQETFAVHRRYRLSYCHGEKGSLSYIPTVTFGKRSPAHVDPQIRGRLARPSEARIYEAPALFHGSQPGSAFRVLETADSSSQTSVRRFVSLFCVQILIVALKPVDGVQ